MTTEKYVQQLIAGNSVSISDERELKEVRAELIRIKGNCSIVLGQIKERLETYKRIK